MSMAYYDAGSVQGVWVVDRDDSDAGSENPVPDAESGDDIAFLQLDGSLNSLGYRQFALPGNPTKIEIEDVPGAPNPLQGGRVGNLFVDKDTGDLIIVEEGFLDTLALGGPGDTEPAVLRRSVNYNSGGQIALGAFHDLDPVTTGTQPKLFLAPAKSPADTSVERGYWSAYDSENDKLYFTAPGFFFEGPPFEMDIYVLDLTTGVTTSYLDTDDNVYMSTFTGDVHNADKVVVFTLAELEGDYNGDGVVDAADYIYWRRFDLTPPGYNKWVSNFGRSLTPGAGSGVTGAVPEPASIALVLAGFAVLCGYRRRAL
jgi:hypothetical protein